MKTPLHHLNLDNSNQEIIIYNADDGSTKVALMTRDGNVWLNQNQLAELFDTSKQNISLHIINILKENELDENSVVKDYLTTAADGKNYNVTFYSLDLILAVGFRVRSKRGTQFSKRTIILTLSLSCCWCHNFTLTLKERLQTTHLPLLSVRSKTPFSYNTFNRQFHLLSRLLALNFPP